MAKLDSYPYIHPATRSTLEMTSIQAHLALKNASEKKRSKPRRHAQRGIPLLGPSFTGIYVLIAYTLICVCNNNRLLLNTKEDRVREIEARLKRGGFTLHSISSSISTQEWRQASEQVRDRWDWQEEIVDVKRAKELHSMEIHLKERFPGIVSCRRTQDGNFTKFNDQCLEQLNGVNSNGAQILLYNPFYMPRIVCGHRIEAKGASMIPRESTDLAGERCWSSPHPGFGMAKHTKLFPVIPTEKSSSQLPPIEILDKDHKSSLSHFADCNIPCYAGHGDDTKNIQVKTIGETDWTIVHSMEGPNYYPELRRKPKAHLDNRFYATTSFRSEIPLPYFSFAEYNLQKSKPVEYETAIHGAVFMAQNCASHNRREKVVRDLIRSRQIRVYSVGNCLKNAPWPRDAATKEQALSKYLFYLAFENQNEDDYITEKLWGALSAGVVPVYLGAANIQNHVPPHSIINVKDFNSTRELAIHLGNVAQNKDLYEKYHSWRQEPLPESFLAKYNFTRTHSVCRMCRWAFHKKYGLGWNHNLQEIRDPHIPRSVCLQSHQTLLLAKPFRESWFSPASQKSVVDTPALSEPTYSDVCDDHMSGLPSSDITLSRGALRRVVLSRDGIIDMFLEPIPRSKSDSLLDTVVLQLETPILMAWNASQEPLQEVTKWQYWVQDETSRITLLTNRDDLTIHTRRQEDNNGQLLLQIVVPNPSIPLRLRFIIEDINTFYDTGQDEPQHFAKTMIDDWMTPVERFLVAPSHQLPPAPKAVVWPSGNRKIHVHPTRVSRRGNARG